MADLAEEVPVSDVLCDAMEYLSKLGLNLRTRTESLKEKKINKNKLKNAHAVQKAANKVLLICELSKKSLENVETGVKRVLSIVDAAQASSPGVGGKSSVSDGGNMKENTIEDKSQYQYFEYGSRKLKLSRRVPLKHYTSVKVFIKNMPRKMQDKYPVYYDCKLYRVRKRLSLKANPLEKTSLNPITTDDEKKTSSDELVANTGRQYKNNIEKLNMFDIVREELPTKDKIDKNEEEASIKDRLTNTVEKLDTTLIHRSECTNIENVCKNRSYSIDEGLQTSKRKDVLKCTISLSSEDDDDELSKKSTKSTKVKSRNFKSTSHEEENIVQRSKEKGENKQKHYSKIRVISDNSLSDDGESIIMDHNENKNIEESDQNVYNDLKSKEKIDSNNSSDQESKPLIKCVNINKLLRPDIAPKTKTIDGKCKNNLEIVQHRLKQKEADEKYWAQKRKEVSAFRAKKVDVDITRLPTKYSVDFMTSNHLNKIFHNGIIVSSVSSLPSVLDKYLECPKDDKQLSQQNNTSKVKDVSSDMDNVRKALLNDSDTDDDEHKKGRNQNSAKNALLCESDQEENNSTVAENMKVLEIHNINPSEKSNMSECKQKDISTANNDQTNVDDKQSSPTNNDDTLQVMQIIDPKNIKATLLYDSSDEDESHPVVRENKSHEDKDVNKRQSDDENNPSNDDTEKKSDKNNSDEETHPVLTNVVDTPQVTSDSPNEIIDPKNIKATLLYDSSDEDESHPVVRENKSHEDKDVNKRQSDDENNPSNDDTEKKSDKNNSDEETHPVLTNVVDTPQVTSDSPNEIKSALHNDSSNDSLNSIKKKTDKKNSDEETHPVLTNVVDTAQVTSDGPNEIKSALLNDSSNDSLNSIKKKTDDTPSKRKRIMESIKAKRMSLRYSSSSDTEDEQLKTALNNIKDSLLKEGSSSDELNDNIQKQEETHSERLSSSGSEEDRRYRAKRKKEAISPEKDEKLKDKSKSSNKKMGRTRGKQGSSTNNSDTPEASDNVINGLTNLKSLRKTRQARRDGSGSGMSEEESSRKGKRVPKTVSIPEEQLLEAESESEAASEADSDVEALPQVTLTPINGDAIDHLAKDDLLVESDESSNSDKSSRSEELKKEESSDGEENVKSKRRKANAISSDSEAGSSRKKDADVKMSDFEDSEADSSSARKSKRKKKGSDSDASGGSSSNEGNKKKRRRIKQLNDSDASGSDNENEGKNKHGRKNIRKVMSKDQLEEATKKAAREERERCARIAERQKLYNNLEFDESGKPDEVVLEKVVLDFDPETKEPLIEVDRGLVKKLKPHQANGIKFMWNACFESVRRIKKDKGSGCILAHCMGLGKTLQVVTLTHTLLTHGALTGVRRVLVVCPLSTVLNWVNEFRMWLRHAEADYEVDIYELSKNKQNSERAFQLQQWVEGGGVCVLGYEMFRNLSADNNKKYKKKMLRTFQESLVHPGPDLVVCDEGHLLKNEKTSLSQSMNRVKTLRRIVLTGTPLQNNLKEYYCMVQFVKPNLLGKYNEYLNRFVNPITNGQYTDSTEHDIRIMKRRSHVLHKMLDGAVQRRDYGVLAPFLPPKHEYVLFITLTDVQIKLYQHYLDNYSRRPCGKASGFLFPDFQSLQRIWTHPLVLKYNSERYEIMQQKKREREEEDSEGSLVDFIDDDSTPDETTEEESSDDLSDDSDDSRKKSKKKKSTKKGGKSKEGKAGTRRGTRANPVEQLAEELPPPPDDGKPDNPTEWWVELVSDDELDDLRKSHKLLLLFDILKQCEIIGDKLLVFSQSLYSLDLIEHFLNKIDEATQEGRIDEKLAGHIGTWAPGVDYFRLDGSTSCENRSIWCKNFNREDNQRARLFLISTRAGGLGINLVAANRVVIFDVSWNPSHDVQSIFRVYRFGQKKPCYVYRFLAMGTMEEKIYERQVTKQAISKRVIDEQQIDRHYAENDLAELYKFEPRPAEPRPVPALPKDRLFAEMLMEHEDRVYKFHEHDSLLENKEEETLSEEERKAAWEDFENEKNRPPPAAYPQWPPNGMAGLLAQQQQQLAYAALASILRKDMPNMNENQIRLIYNANPAMFGGYDYGLMQKMSEIYKYTQPGMMNAMMGAPMMNPAGGGGGAASGAMGGSSGLQYDPAWQRQQQQMRLQQLLHQQNQMGAKMYAGGLGSRDPVAMAMQQQRARELMLGERGRPRGRPPLQPRAAPPPGAAPAPAPTLAPPADVVNLDSD